MLVSPKKRQTKRKKPPKPGAPPPAGNHREDAAVEAELAAKGIPVELGPPAGATREELALAEIEQLILSDATLANRPQLRRLIKHLSTQQVQNMDGSPVMVGKPGAEKPIAGSMWEAFVRAGMLRAINGDEAWAERVWTTIYGKPREALELSGSGGGAIQTNALVNHRMPSEEEMAARFVRATRLARDILTKDGRAEALAEAIEVGANVALPPEVTKEPVDIQASAVPPIGPGGRPGVLPPPLQPPQKPAPASQPPPSTGMIPTRR
jgi:hypothetical protein